MRGKIPAALAFILRWEIGCLPQTSNGEPPLPFMSLVVYESEERRGRETLK
jgi:hypothetical protein